MNSPKIPHTIHKYTHIRRPPHIGLRPALSPTWPRASLRIKPRSIYRSVNHQTPPNTHPTYKHIIILTHAIITKIVAYNTIIRPRQASSTARYTYQRIHMQESRRHLASCYNKAWVDIGAFDPLNTQRKLTSHC